MLRTIDLNGVKTAYAVTGSGAPIVLAHGATTDLTVFDNFARLLAPHYTVISYDQRDSGRTTNAPEPYTVLDLADDAAALIGALGYGKAHFVGVSLGGVIAQALAVRRPERVDRAVMVFTYRIGESLAALSPDVAPKLRALAADREKNARAMAAMFMPEDEITPEIVTSFRHRANTPEQGARRAPLVGPCERLDLAKITVPTAVVAGAADTLIPLPHAKSLAAEIPGAKLTVLDGVGHYGTMQAPERTARAVLDALAG
ncbi:MAG: alpha/beta fold hydrolase [Alphaproteobacteria bacterium]